MTNAPDRAPVIDRYIWADGARLRGNADAFFKQAEALRTPDGIAEEALLEANRPAGAPLHADITWDIEAAARKQQLGEVGHALRSLRRIPVSVVTEEPLPAERVYVPRALVRTTTDDHAPRVYVPVALARSDEEQQDRIRSNALDRVERLIKEFKSIAPLADLAGDLEALLLKYR